MERRYRTQSEGALDEVKGKVQNTWGKVKDSARDMKHDVERDADHSNKDVESDRDRDAA